MYVWEGNVLIVGMWRSYSLGLGIAKIAATKDFSSAYLKDTGRWIKHRSSYRILIRAMIEMYTGHHESFGWWVRGRLPGGGDL